MHVPGRGEGALRRQRISVSGASYFITACCDGARRALHAKPTAASALRDELHSIECDSHWRIRAAVLMPDHVHLLVQLTGTLSLSRCIARLKAKTRRALSLAGLIWQQNFYEHRLRPGDPVEDVIRYIFLNPYREKLVAVGEPYPWFWLGADEAEWFPPITDEGQPFPEWLR